MTDTIVDTAPDAKLVLEAALGMSGRQSYLVAERNLVVEGVDDFWLLTEVSRLAHASGKPHISFDIHITPSGGASEGVYIATFMVGQKLDVFALFDSDDEGRRAAESLTTKWLTKYQSSRCCPTLLGDGAGISGNCSIEDMFEIDWYLHAVNETYSDRLNATGGPLTAAELPTDKMVVDRIRAAFEQRGLPKFNHGSVAKRLRKRLLDLAEWSGLPEATQQTFATLFETINAFFATEED